MKPASRPPAADPRRAVRLGGSLIALAVGGMGAAPLHAREVADVADVAAMAGAPLGAGNGFAQSPQDVTPVAASPAASPAPAPAPTPAPGTLPAPASTPASTPVRLNPTGRTISLSAPLRDGPFQLSEVDFRIGSDDSISIGRESLIMALRARLAPERIAELEQRLAGMEFAPLAQMAAAGYPISYDPATISLSIDIPAASRTTTTIQLSGLDRAPRGDFAPPADFSAYLNIRSFADYAWDGPERGLTSPSALLDSAVRVRGFVLENEASARSGGLGRKFVREGTRLVFDDRDRLIRWTAGDLRPVGRGFAGSPQMAGFSAQRIYSIVDPLRLVQPTGDRSFTLSRSATVEAVINGQQIRRLRLQPGVYNIRDLPFVQGTNDVQFIIEDDAGGREVIRFTEFFERTLLAPGLTEFAVHAGVLAPFDGGARNYQLGEPAASGWARRGINSHLTLGGNFNVRKSGGVAGAEAVLATSFGTLGVDAAFSINDVVGNGMAVNIGLQRSFGSMTGRAKSVSASAEYRSANFSNPGALIVDNRFSWIGSAAYSQSIGERQYVSISGTYLLGRGANANEQSARLTYGLSVNPRTSVLVEGSYENRAQGQNGWAVRAGLVMRLGRRSSASAEVDSRNERARIGYQTSHGDGVGAWSASGDADFGYDDVNFNGSANYTANRAEIALAHNSSVAYGNAGREFQRSSIRMGTAIVFADGAIALSRPVTDSFAIVVPHRSLNGAAVYTNPNEDGYSAKSGMLGGAVEPNLSAYFARNLTFDVPNAPVGYDLGAGAARVLPPYRSGFRIDAGSDYSVTAIGSLIGPNGQPVSLLVGRAIELSAPDRAPVTLFTNREGRFGAPGLRAGRWRIDMPTVPPSSIEITIAEGETGVARLGSLTMTESEGDRP